MIEANPLPISMITNHHLSTTRGDPFEDVMLYQSVVSALQYVTITRSKIAYNEQTNSIYGHSLTSSLESSQEVASLS